MGKIILFFVSASLISVLDEIHLYYWARNNAEHKDIWKARFFKTAVFFVMLVALIMNKG